MTKEEILKLHELSEEEQYQWLDKNHIIGLAIDLNSGHFTESLADCSFRLRDETDEELFLICLDYVTTAVDYGVKFLKDDGEWFPIVKTLEERDFEYDNYVDLAKRKYEPIHWIQAALLAGLDK